MRNVDFWIDKLNLVEHSEGGYFCESYRSEQSIHSSIIITEFTGSRSLSTAIYFLLPQNRFSAFHRLKSDEIWHFYTGSPVFLHKIYPKGDYTIINLGKNPINGEVFQVVIEADVWFGAKVKKGGSYSLLGCTVSPGFDFNDFELGKRSELLQLYPEHCRIIKELTPVE